VDRAQKRELVSDLNETWKGIGALVVAHYTGMTVAEMTEYRKRMKAAGGAVRVAKNRLAKLSLKGTNAEKIADLLKGQICIAYSGDPISASGAALARRAARDADRLVAGARDQDRARAEGARRATGTRAPGAKRQGDVRHGKHLEG
jgi:large subunit ribosomal protein L10